MAARKHATRVYNPMCFFRPNRISVKSVAIAGSMFGEKISVAVKAMMLIAFVVKKGARTVSAAPAVAVAMKPPLLPRDGPTRPRRHTDRHRSGYLRCDELLRPRLELSHSEQHPNNFRHADRVDEHERQDEVPVGRHREELLPEQEDVTDFVGEHRAEGEPEDRDREDPQRDRDVTANIRLRFLQGIELEHDRLEHH